MAIWVSQRLTLPPWIGAKAEAKGPDSPIEKRAVRSSWGGSGHKLDFHGPSQTSRPESSACVGGGGGGVLGALTKERRDAAGMGGAPSEKECRDPMGDGG